MIKPDSLFLVLYATSVKTIRDFYMYIGANITEFIEGQKCVVEVGGNGLHFIEATDEKFLEYQQFTRKPQNNGRGHGILTYFEVDDLDQFYMMLENQHVNLVCAPKANLWDYREFAFQDPDGYVLVAYGK